jgi:hypothetical protein
MEESNFETITIPILAKIAFNKDNILGIFQTLAQKNAATGDWYLERFAKHPEDDFNCEDIYSDLEIDLQETLIAHPYNLAGYQLKEITQKRIYNWFAKLPVDKKLVYVSELREIFTDKEIKTITWDVPQGWDYSAMSSSQTNVEWFQKNMANLIAMENGNIVYYFYRN